ncbi:FAD:protein FMN transferase [Pseudomonas hefeiensis]|uniref:FAD:protein FMN transferase n=1 Tax=Pseudomonas hefeiensis TaxID=2738125 RepID=A0ABY9GIH8_9PSED|nr:MULTISPECIES: FAD:protein FMN transferase [unclassified Pseudomonas]WLH15477.1 FAD:protein FMN transferase [Pseudomonas sp. FP205]WLH98524.1 FAD:protein FMN transferase [Pseudomonas sp. FP53]WLI42785.1 FAD:protein FMN transferase [Pseudomonas sp. FP821]
MSTELQRYSLNGETMGTRYTALFYAGAGMDTDEVGRSLACAVARVDQQMSIWKPDSDLNRLNSAPELQWVSAPKELVAVLAAALRVSEQSGGAFDIAVGDLVEAWGFGCGEKPVTQPPLGTLSPHVRPSASAGLVVDRQRNQVRKRGPLNLNLNGIAKGFGVDELARCLEGFGITCYLVGIDGEMRAGDLKPDAQPWKVAIEKPCRGVREVMGVMELSKAAIATSGDYRHWVDVKGQSYAHTMNPATGAPACNSLVAVTVVASSCMLADAWATALLVLGETEGPRLAQERGMDALFVLRDADQFKEISIVGGQLQTQIQTH